ncbi:MAG: hypothetical protein PHE56_16340 [Bacteroidales bacterium]|jgi:hypothetical protein|nr:hypothetical protein [Bacteroidales bacterium]
MKRFAIILTVVAATAMLFSSCGKYEEGPSFSLLTKKARIAGEWKMSEVTVDGTVQDLGEGSMSYVLEKDGTGDVKVTWAGLTLTFDVEWEFDEAKENLRVRTKDENDEWDEWMESEIIRLTNSELWTRDVETIANVDVVTITKYTKI